MPCLSHRLMLFKLSQNLARGQCAEIGRIYELPAPFFDDIERNPPGLTLIRALEQRRKICEDATIMKEFIETLEALEYEAAAKIVCLSYPQPSTGSSKQGETTETGGVVMTAQDNNASSKPGETTETGGVVMPPHDDKDKK